jgi:cellulose synthase (UDP-forming)
MFTSVVAVAWFALTLLGATPTRYEIPWAAYGAFAWLIVNVLLLIGAIRRIRSERYAAERRASYRFETVLSGRLDGAPARILDVSLTGARVAVSDLSAASVHFLVVELESGPTVLEADLRSTRPAETGETIAGLEFRPGQHAARASLALGLFNVDVVPDVGVPALAA